MAIVTDLQKSALENKPLTELLRKALLVATKLGVKEFSDWIENELNGYKDFSNIPEYRKVNCELKAFNPFHGWQPILFANKETNALFTTNYITQPISEVEELMNAKGNILSMSISPENKLIIMKAISHELEIELHASKTSAVRVCDAVKTLILKWALKLEEEGILGDDSTFSIAEKSIAHSSTSISIHNFQGILGDVNDSEVHQALTFNILENNFDDLKNELLNRGISQADLNSLEIAIESDGRKPESPRKFGQKVSDWLGNMITKAASGVWDISVKVASEVLTKALCQYYGLK